MFLRFAAVLLVAVLSLGCPFLEALDDSSKQMDKYSPTARKEAKEKKAAAAVAAADKEAGGGGSGFASAKGKAGAAAASAKDAAANWWANATTLTPDERDPDLVRCQLPAGGVEFMRKHDCLMRSGLANK
jgi:hypothetical protein